jgi:hypothetical protein
VWLKCWWLHLFDVLCSLRLRTRKAGTAVNVSSSVGVGGCRLPLSNFMNTLCSQQSTHLYDMCGQFLLLIINNQSTNTILLLPQPEENSIVHHEESQTSTHFHFMSPARAMHLQQRLGHSWLLGRRCWR